MAAAAEATITKDTRLPLGDGKTMPCLGFGTYLIKEEDAEAPVTAALKMGYPHIDTAAIYGNEAAVGRALAASGVARSDVFVTTKLWAGNPDWDMEPKTYESTIAACRESLEKLGLESVDLYLIHTPLGGGKEGRLAQWRGMVECQKLGLATSIGVSNFGIAHIEELIEAGLPVPAANQLELHPYNSKPELLAYMKTKGILPIAYSSLAPMSSWREGQQSAKTDEHRTAESPVAAIAAKYAAGDNPKSEAQVLLRYALQRGWAILPKSVKAERAEANMALFDFEISEEDMKALDALDKDEVLAFGSAGKPLDPTKVA